MSAMLGLENGKKLFIKAKDEVIAQCLRKVIAIIQRDYIGKRLKDMISREFCLAEKIDDRDPFSQ